MPATRSVVGFADHITTVLDIDELRSMSEALFATGLTQGWPLSEQPGFATAGIRLGNLNLEICSVDRTQNKLDDRLTFEPTDLDTLADDLVKRDISHDPFDAVVVHGHPIYTRVGIPSLATESTVLQLCHTFYPTRTTGPVAPENSAGIKQVNAVHVGADSVHLKALRKLMAPRDWQDSITFTEGPPLNVSAASQLEVQGLTVSAADPAHAARELVASGMSPVDKHSVRVGSLTVTIES